MKIKNNLNKLFNILLIIFITINIQIKYNKIN